MSGVEPTRARPMTGALPASLNEAAFSHRWYDPGGGNVRTDGRAAARLPWPGLEERLPSQQFLAGPAGVLGVPDRLAEVGEVVLGFDWRDDRAAGHEIEEFGSGGLLARG